MKIKQWFTAFLVVALTVAWCPCAMAQGKGGGKDKGGDSAEYTIVTLDERPGDHPGWVRDVVKIGDDWYCPGLMDEKVGNQIVDSWAVVWQVSPSGSSYTVTTHELAAGDFAAAMNEWGEIIGSNGFSGLYWSSLTATPLVLPPLASGSVTEPYGINADGVIVGEFSPWPGARRQAAWGNPLYWPRNRAGWTRSTIAMNPELPRPSAPSTDWVWSAGSCNCQTEALLW